MKKLTTQEEEVEEKKSKRAEAQANILKFIVPQTKLNKIQNYRINLFSK